MASPLLDKFREQNPELSGTSDEALADFLHKTYYSDIPFSKFAQTVGVADPNEAGPVRSYGLIPILKGVGDIGGAVGYGLEATGIAPEFGKEVQQSAQDTEQRLTERQSLQAQEDAKQRLFNPDGSLGDFNFGTFAQQAGRSLPGMFVMGVPGGILAKGATTAAKALGAGAAADTIGSGLGFGAAEGVFSGATNAAQEQQTIRNTPFDKLADNPAFIETYHNETDPTLDQNTRLEQARDIMARKAGDEVFGKTTLSTGAIGALTGGGLFGQLRQGTSGGLLARAAKGFAKEAGQEAPQSAGEQYIQNVAEQKYLDPNTDPYKDVLTSAVEGGLVGGALGLGGVFSPSREKEETDKQIHALSDTQATQAIGAAPTVDDAIAAAGAALEPSKIVADATVPGIPLQEFLDQQIKAPDAQRIVDYSTVPGTPVQQAIDNQYQPTGYVPGEAGQVWETPNAADADRQAQINRAFYEKEMADLAQKESELRAMENAPHPSKSQIKQYRKARADLEVEKQLRAEFFRDGLGFNIVPNRAGTLSKNTQLADQLGKVAGDAPMPAAYYKGAPNWQSPKFKVSPFIDALLRRATVPAQDLREYIDSQGYKDTGYVPGDLGQVWESPNTADADKQAQINRAFYEKEQAELTSKAAALYSAERNPRVTPQLAKQYRKARVGLELEKRLRAEFFRAGLGFNIVPNRSGEVRNTQLQDQLRALQSGRPTEPIGRNAELNTDPATASGDLAGSATGDLPTAPAWESPAARVISNAPTDQNFQPIAQPERGNDRTGLVADPGAVIGNDGNLPQQQQGDVPPGSGSDDLGRSALAPQSPRAYQFRGYSEGVEPTVIPDTQASAPGLAPDAVSGKLKIGDVVQAKPGSDAIGGTITAIREYGKKQFIETDQSGGRRFEASKFVAEKQQDVAPEAQSAEANRQKLAEVRQQIQAYESFLACLRR
jgi:hypothetical protein